MLRSAKRPSALPRRPAPSNILPFTLSCRRGEAARQNQGGPGGIISPGGVRGGAPLLLSVPFHSIFSLRGNAPARLSSLPAFPAFPRSDGGGEKGP